MLRRPAIRQIRLQVEPLEDRCVLSSSAYITGLYQNLLHRTPSPLEVANWVAVLDRTGNPALVANGFVTSPEFRANLVRFDYQVLLQRTPGPQEVGYFVNRLAAGLSEDQLEAVFLTSNEYFALHGNDPTSWQEAALNDVLGQGVPLTNLVNNAALAIPALRFQVAFSLVHSTAAHTRVVTTDYEALLQRLPDPAGLANWVSQLDAGVNPSQVLVGIVSSPEYIGLTSQGGLDGQPPLFVAQRPVTLAANPVFIDPFTGTNLQGHPFVLSPFTFNPVLGTSLGGNNLFQAFPIP